VTFGYQGIPAACLLVNEVASRYAGAHREATSSLFPDGRTTLWGDTRTVENKLGISRKLTHLLDELRAYSEECRVEGHEQFVPAIPITQRAVPSWWPRYPTASPTPYP
jgi:hypothetical protein